ncbi:molecular chaperone [Pseudomonas tremae]|uniref:fimbrial biogenesis chaperone n=1 Tax=Pseudomonas syringae group TaxID=136849 RepID=UPI000EFFC069|nr:MULTISPECIES: molecular chaperone [Pseudomonas syringae group]MCF5802593.1 fimbria/pilus periplasmic chaperone [Pseudomonas tremae]MCF5808562.1 fimbria/pilus periplasmic chaperone [Pseudomonas tremae]MCQ3027461.1 molecular chaperone [Pseudomonas tremae]RMN35175.1 Fimbral chaperone protein [Pseudomonas coronafaciens pv. zizaniae]
MNVSNGLCAMILIALLASGVDARGAISLSGTRLIFDGHDPEAFIEVRNRGKGEALLQTWLSDPRDSDDTPHNLRRSLPFAITPPLVRLTAGGRQTLRVLYQGQGMPQQRESLLHLYVLEVPRRQQGIRQLNIAVRQRINVFYRPPDLDGDPADTAGKLLWTLNSGNAGSHLFTVSNPTPYHASLQGLRMDGVLFSDHLLLAPGEHFQLVLPKSFLPSANTLFSYGALTDYGGQRGYCVRVNGQATYRARLLEKNVFQEEC